MGRSRKRLHIIAQGFSPEPCAARIRPESIFNSPRRMQLGEGARPRAPRRACQNPVVYSRLRLLNVLGFGNNPAAAGRGRDPSQDPNPSPHERRPGRVSQPKTYNLEHRTWNYLASLANMLK
jgi:hypothetical protein